MDLIRPTMEFWISGPPVFSFAGVRTWIAGNNGLTSPVPRIGCTGKENDVLYLELGHFP